MSTPIISIESLGKRYRVKKPNSAGGAGLRHALEAGARNLWNGLGRMAKGQAPFDPIPPEEEFWALKDVSFEVQQGECVGIIGRNGAGKSTLLKILSRITEPSAGRAILRGRVGSLLEVGTGFHPELTGRENIFLNGSILGMRRHEILRQLDEIIAFAEVDQFLDTPVKYYSSGMHMRLAFAVAAHLDPEILIVDEVLAVGDAQFQKKCMGKISEVAKQGKTVLFVSHNMAVVQSLCENCIYLEMGKVVANGTAGMVVKEYLGNSAVEFKTFSLQGRKFKPLNCEIISAHLEVTGKSVGAIIFGDQANIILMIKVNYPIRFAVELILRQQDGVPVAFAPSGLARGWEVDGYPGKLVIRCKLPPAFLAAGKYSIDLMTVQTKKQILDHIESAINFTIDSSSIGNKNWNFTQTKGQGHQLWDVEYEIQN